MTVVDGILDAILDAPGYGGWDELGDMLADVRDGMPSTSRKLESSDILKEICRSQYPSRSTMADMVGVAWGTLHSAMVAGRRPSLRTAKKISDAACRPDYLEKVLEELVAGAKTHSGPHGRRWSMSMDISTYKNLYNFYQKALRSGVSPPGDVHHEMGKIYRRLKKAGEVG